MFPMRTVHCVAALALLAAGCGSSHSEPPGLSKLSGAVYSPVEGAILHVYRPSEDIRGPSFTQIGPLGPDARFSLDLPPGDYLLVARRRRGGDETGPVRDGDIKSDPVRVRIEPGKPLALNLLAYIKQGNPKETLGSEADWKASVAGTIADPEGKPVEGVRVHIYEHVQMSERPKFVSAKTGPDGRYLVKLPKGGTYYLCARDKYGGPPKVGDLYGRYDKGTVEPSAVIVPETGAAKGIDITVHTVW
jgi:hypothetical protein